MQLAHMAALSRRSDLSSKGGVFSPRMGANEYLLGIVNACIFVEEIKLDVINFWKDHQRYGISIDIFGSFIPFFFQILQFHCILFCAQIHPTHPWNGYIIGSWIYFYVLHALILSFEYALYAAWLSYHCITISSGFSLFTIDSLCALFMHRQVLGSASEI